jgi:tRNA threonylcarbamoyl adenosine modification protein YeaZ
MNDLTLFMDTTTSRLMLALGRGGKLIAAQNVPCDSHRYHSALMIPAIQDMLKDNGFTVNDLSALAVNLGPGSFTGIRTGVITARTMGQFLNLPVHGFNTFELLAATYDYPLAIYLEALRGRAYHATVCWDEQGPRYWRQPPGMLLLNDDDVPSPPMQARLLITPGLECYFPWAKPNFIAPDFYSPAAMAQLMARFGQRFARPWQDILPFYLQEPSITLKKNDKALSPEKVLCPA